MIQLFPENAGTDVIFKQLERGGAKGKVWHEIFLLSIYHVLPGKNGTMSDGTFLEIMVQTEHLTPDRTPA